MSTEVETSESIVAGILGFVFIVLRSSSNL